MNDYILTFDYELFGSGKGCVVNHLIKPTEKILNILDKYNIKATFYVEQLEIDAIISLKNRFSVSSKEYRDAALLENQLIEIAKKGHDIQLHLHPQWYGATYQNCEWKLNFDWWRFSSLPFRTLKDGTPGKYDLIQAGVESLVKRVQEIKPDYQCHSFRAGGYNIGDDKDSVQSLVENGIISDSSVCPGFFTNSALSQYDYSTVDDEEGYWYSNTSFLKTALPDHDESRCIELPLISINSSLKEKLSFARIFSTIKNRKFKKNNYIGSSGVFVTKNSDKIRNSNFDVCLSSKQQINKFKSHVVTLNRLDKSPRPIVLIGHPKDFSIFSPLASLLKELSESNRFVTVDCFLMENFK